MKALIAILLLLGAFWVTKRIFNTYQDVERSRNTGEQTSPAPAPPPAPTSTLAGLPPYLEASLSTAEKQGAAGLRDWLRNYRAYAKDPRLASIELDYVVLISHADPAEARRIFEDVKSRTPTFSPIYDRVKRLEKTFQ
jgi:hypothetical protein